MTVDRCLDCGIDCTKGDWYMVRDEVWAATGLGPGDGVLCLADLRRRLGRPLRLDDFGDDLPINYEDFNAALGEAVQRKGRKLSGQLRKEILRAIAAG
jgi:hypothetical protein